MLSGKVTGQLAKKSVFSPPEDRSKAFHSIDVAIIGATYRVSCTAEQSAPLIEGSAYDFECRVVPKDGKNKIELLNAIPRAK